MIKDKSEQLEDDKIAYIEKHFLGIAILTLDDIECSYNHRVIRNDHEVALYEREFADGLVQRLDTARHVTALLHRSVWEQLPSIVKSIDGSLDRWQPQMIHWPSAESVADISSELKAGERLQLDICRGGALLEACQRQLHGLDAWWIFRIYDKDVDAGGKAYLYTRGCRQVEATHVDVLIHYQDSLGDHSRTDLVRRQLFKPERARIEQLLRKNCVIGPHFLKLLEFKPLFHDNHKLGQLNSVLPSRLHEEIKIYLCQVYEVWHFIRARVEHFDTETVRALEGLYPRYCQSHKELIRSWADEHVKDTHNREELLGYLFNLEKIVSLGTFFQDVKLILYAESAIRRIVSEGHGETKIPRGLSLSSLCQAIASRTDDFYVRWCELVLCCVRQCLDLSATQLDVAFLSKTRDHARYLGLLQVCDGTEASPASAVLNSNSVVTSTKELEKSAQSVPIKRSLTTLKESNAYARLMRNCIKSVDLQVWRQSLITLQLFPELEQECSLYITPHGVMTASMACFFSRSRLKESRNFQLELYKDIQARVSHDGRCPDDSALHFGHILNSLSSKSSPIADLKEMIQRLGQTHNKPDEIARMLFDKLGWLREPLLSEALPIIARSKSPMQIEDHDDDDDDQLQRDMIVHKRKELEDLEYQITKATASLEDIRTESDELKASNMSAKADLAHLAERIACLRQEMATSSHSTAGRTVFKQTRKRPRVDSCHSGQDHQSKIMRLAEEPMGQEAMEE